MYKFWLCAFYYTISFRIFIEKMDNVVLQAVIFILALFVGIAWVEFEHNITIYKILILYCFCPDK